MKDRLPDFLIIGIMRGGTTSLFQYMRQHPSILGPIKGQADQKEINFFNIHWNKGIDWYKNCWPPRNMDFLFGEATPDYLCDPPVPERVSRMLPQNIKFIVLLRNPVDRLWSHYCHYRDHELKGMTEQDIQDMTNYINGKMKIYLHINPYPRERIFQMGFYALHLERWFKFFNQEQFFILESGQFFDNPDIFTNRAFDFLNLKPYHLGKYDNIDILKRIRPKARYPKISDKLGEVLREFYAPYNNKLYGLLGIDYGW